MTRSLTVDSAHLMKVVKYALIENKNVAAVELRLPTTSLKSLHINNCNITNFQNKGGGYIHILDQYPVWQIKVIVIVSMHKYIKKKGLSQRILADK